MLIAYDILTESFNYVNSIAHFLLFIVTLYTDNPNRIFIMCIKTIDFIEMK
jgi:hypothetical protein